MVQYKDIIKSNNYCITCDGNPVKYSVTENKGALSSIVIPKYKIISTKFTIFLLSNGQ